MLPPGGASPSGSGPNYGSDERRAPSMDGLSLPELPGTKNANQYYSGNSIGRAYPYKSTLD